MAQNCKKSCQMCGPESYFRLTDTDSSCSVWAKAGWCQAITDLLDKCPHSCQKYGVQGASSLEERYITVNFRDSSSVAAPTFSEIVAPPPPPGGISPQSDINLLSPDLQVALANEWWDSTLFKLTQKQNEYVTHPEPRPHPISLKKANSTQLNLTGNETTKITHANKTTGGAVKETSKIEFSEKGEMLAVSASAPPPRAYDALLPKLFLSNGPSWTKAEKLKDTNQKVEVNQKIRKTHHKEDNDEVVDRNGQQKAEVPLVELEKEYEQSGISNMDTAMSSGSGLMVIDGGNEDLMVISSGENEAEGDETSGKDETISLLASGSGEEIKEQYVSGEETKEQDVSGEKEENNAEGINPWGFTNVLSGSGEDNTSKKHRISLHSSGNGPQSRERIEIVSPDYGFSGSGQIKTQDTSSAFDDSSSGSDQYEYQ